MYTQAPFLSILYNKKSDKTILCLIQLLTKNCVSFYEINELKPEDYGNFFVLADIWWKRCPILPISLYHKGVFKKYDYCKHHIFANDFQIIGGFSGVNLKYISEKRIKRKLIQMDYI